MKTDDERSSISLRRLWLYANPRYGPRGGQRLRARCYVRHHLSLNRRLQPAVRQGQFLHSSQTSAGHRRRKIGRYRSEEHTSELQSLMRISYAVFCLKKKSKQIVAEL